MMQPRRFTHIGLLLLVSLVIGVGPRTAKADATRDFIVSCSYGVLAGTLVGAATLAFSDRPGDNLNKVARGASLGLYAGILLGAYVVSGGGQGDDAAEAEAILNKRGANDFYLPRNRAVASVSYEPPRLQVYPLLGDRGVEGAGANLRLLNF